MGQLYGAAYVRILDILTTVAKVFNSRILKISFDMPEKDALWPTRK